MILTRQGTTILSTFIIFPTLHSKLFWSLQKLINSIIADSKSIIIFFIDIYWLVFAHHKIQKLHHRKTTGNPSNHPCRWLSGIPISPNTSIQSVRCTVVQHNALYIRKEECTKLHLWTFQIFLVCIIYIQNQTLNPPKLLVLTWWPQ